MIERQGQILQPHKSLHRRVQRDIRQGHGLPDAAGGAGGMNDEGGFIGFPLRVPHRKVAEGRQQRLHADRPVERVHESVLGLLGRRHHRVDGGAGHMHVQDDHMVKSQLLPLEQKLPDQIRLGQVIRENEVRQLLLDNGLLDPFGVKG